MSRGENILKKHFAIDQKNRKCLKRLYLIVCCVWYLQIFFKYLLKSSSKYFVFLWCTSCWLSTNYFWNFTSIVIEHINIDFSKNRVIRLFLHIYCGERIQLIKYLHWLEMLSKNNFGGNKFEGNALFKGFCIGNLINFWILHYARILLNTVYINVCTWQFFTIEQRSLARL